MPSPLVTPPRLLAIAWTLLILALCSIPGDSLPDSSILSFDKLGHFGMFAIFGWLWSRMTTPAGTWWVLAGGIAFAVATEIYQGLLPFDRTPDPFDALADLIGLLTGILTYRLWMRRQAKQTA